MTPVPVTLKVTPKALKFSKTAIGTPSKPKTVKVSNPKGNKKHPASAVLIEMVSDTPGVFTASNGCSASLEAGSSCPISVTFTPTAAGAQGGTLTIMDNTNAGMQTVSLTGTGK
jgi:Abnormal spindle-like microcephaly-assoc'd, ASPM-SPD-2-Hydin